MLIIIRLVWSRALPLGWHGRHGRHLPRPGTRQLRAHRTTAKMPPACLGGFWPVVTLHAARRGVDGGRRKCTAKAGEQGKAKLSVTPSQAHFWLNSQGSGMPRKPARHLLQAKPKPRSALVLLGDGGGSSSAGDGLRPVALRFWAPGATRDPPCHLPTFEGPSIWTAISAGCDLRPSRPIHHSPGFLLPCNRLNHRAAVYYLKEGSRSWQSVYAWRPPSSAHFTIGTRQVVGSASIGVPQRSWSSNSHAPTCRGLKIR